MKIKNKDFWEKEDIIATQEVLHSISDFERFMLKQARGRQKGIRPIETIKIFGCGTGREIQGIAEYYNPKKIVASDIANNMIAKCNENLKIWGIDKITETLVINAAEYDNVEKTFDIVTILNSMLTYVPKKMDRMKIFANAFRALKPNAVLIGTVHNQVGTKSKTTYFKIRRMFGFILGEKVGNRSTGMKGFKVPGYYYHKKELVQNLKDSGFKDIEVYSLEEYYALTGNSYDKNKGYNNLIFMASKP